MTKPRLTLSEQLHRLQWAAELEARRREAANPRLKSCRTDATLKNPQTHIDVLRRPIRNG